MGVQIPPGTPMIKSIGQIIFDDLAKSGVFEKLTVSQCVYEVLKHVLGELSNHVKILGFRNGIITIGTPNSVFKQELSFMEDLIVNRVNEIMGEKIVKGIKFKEVF